MRRHWIAMMVVVALTGIAGGCDTAYMVSRSATVRPPPTDAQLAAALHDTPAIRSINRYPVLPEDSAEGAGDRFECHGDAARVAVGTRRDDKGTGRTVDVYCAWMNHDPSAAELADARRLINEAYRSLHARIPGVPPLAASQEGCLNVPGR